MPQELHFRILFLDSFVKVASEKELKQCGYEGWKDTAQMIKSHSWKMSRL